TEPLEIAKKSIESLQAAAAARRTSQLSSSNAIKAVPTMISSPLRTDSGFRPLNMTDPYPLFSRKPTNNINVGAAMRSQANDGRLNNLSSKTTSYPIAYFSNNGQSRVHNM